MACSIKKGVNYECTHSHLGEVRSSHQGPRLPPPSRIDGAYLPGLWLPEWWAYEAQVLIPYISNGPLIFWMYPVFGIRGASWFLGVSEWLFGALLFLGFWNKRLGILGAI